MSARSKDARAAMRAVIAAAPVTPGECQDGVATWRIAILVDVAHYAWSVADAMAAERAKRTEAEAPKPWPPDRDPAADLARALEHLETAKNEEVEAARREGRDAGLREAGDYVWKLRPLATQEARIMLSNVRDGIIELMSQPITSMPSDEAPSPAPDIASLQAELAKLRAVAEAAASMGRTELEIDRRGAAGGLHTIGYNNAVEARKSAAIALAAALDAALPDWRSAP